MNISPIMKPIYKSYAKATEWSLHGKFFNLEKQLEKGAKNPAKYASEMLVLSIVSKDLVGCFLYTTQSWYNKKIPASKRKFVATVDLMNGIVMVGGQFLIGKIIDSKVTPKIIGKKITGILEKNGDKKIINDNAPFSSDNLVEMTKEAIKNNKDDLVKLGVKLDTKQNQIDSINEISDKVIKKIGEDSKLVASYKLGANILIAAIATTALTKRTLAPLISTPMASWFDKKFLDKKGKKAASQGIKVEQSGDKFEQAPKAKIVQNNTSSNPVLNFSHSDNK